MNKKEVMETVAEELGFVADKYYTAKQKMFKACTTHGINSGLCSLV